MIKEMFTFSPWSTGGAHLGNKSCDKIIKLSQNAMLLLECERVLILWFP